MNCYEGGYGVSASSYDTPYPPETRGLIISIVNGNKIQSRVSR